MNYVRRGAHCEIAQGEFGHKRALPTGRLLLGHTISYFPNKHSNPMKFFLFALGWATAFVIHAQTGFSPKNLQAKHLMTSDEYQTAVSDLRGQGWRLTYVSGYTVNNSP